MRIRGIPKPYPGDYGPPASVEGLGSAIVLPAPADRWLAQGPEGLVAWSPWKGVPLTLRLISKATSGALTKLVECRETWGRWFGSQAIRALREASSTY